jgi:hypothetical protein
MLSLRVHEYYSTGGREVLNRTNPYARLTKKDEPTFVVQSGCIYGQGGDLIEPELVPEWVWSRIEAMTPSVRDELKIRKPGGKAHESTKKGS